MKDDDRSGDLLEAFSVAAMNPQARISANFRLYELSRSELAVRRGIDNGFTDDDALRASIYLARNVLQPIREHYKQPISPNSVYRSQALERALKRRPASWISTSQHTQGCACDLEVPGVPTLDLAQWAVKKLKDFDQIICECYDPRQGPNSGWVHISLCTPGRVENRRKELSYIRNPATGRLVYVDGLRASLA